MKPTPEAVLTNIAYAVAGALNILFGNLSGTWNIVLGFASGYHHSKYTDFSKKLDYGGMYAVLTSIALLYIGIPLWANFLLTAIIATGLTRFIGVSTPLIVVGIGIDVLLIGALVSVVWAFGLLTVMCFAYGFNHLGDKVHREHHGIFHGVSWHIPTASVAFIANHLSTGAMTLL